MPPLTVYQVKMSAGPAGGAAPDPLTAELGRWWSFIVYLDGERIVLERKGKARARLFEMAARLAPTERRLSEELIAERRAAAQREQAG